MKQFSISIIGFLLSVVTVMGFQASTPEPNAGNNISPDAESPAVDPFEKAVEIIKKYETLHKPRHWPLVGYGHKVLPGEKYSRSRALSEKEADALLRADLRKNCAVFRSYGADSLLLGTLAYNIGSGNVKKSRVTTALKNGNRNIRELYLAHSRYRGKVHKQIHQRRIEEFDALFMKEIPAEKSKQDSINLRQEIINLGEKTEEFISCYNNPLSKLVSSSCI